ncbi:hypothetical protein WJX82_002480 [Trebouxia sp. C0006]
MPKSSTVHGGVERGMSRSDNLEGSTVRTPSSVAQQALTRLKQDDWIQVADEILSVGQTTDEEFSELANMMVMKGLQSPDNIQSFSEMFVRVMYSLPPNVMWRLRWAFFDATSQAFNPLSSQTVLLKPWYCLERTCCHYYHRIEHWFMAGQMDAVVCRWIMGAALKPGDPLPHKCQGLSPAAHWPG